MHEAEPDLSIYLPTGHEKHEAEPVLALYLPTGHTMHEAEPVLALYLPTGHDKHIFAVPPNEYVPTAQSVHAPSARYWPLGQSLGSALVQTEAPGPLIIPVGHFSHWSILPPSEYVFASQGLHFEELRFGRSDGSDGSDGSGSLDGFDGSDGVLVCTT